MTMHFCEDCDGYCVKYNHPEDHSLINMNQEKVYMAILNFLKSINAKLDDLS